MDWYERAQIELEDDLNNGHIDMQEFNQALRELNAEFRECAEQAGNDAYSNYLGY